jgi:hypothetical protein
MWYTTYGEIAVMEQNFYRVKGGVFRPFAVSAGVGSHKYSELLERILTDFGSDVPFNRVPAKLKEHYGIDIPCSAPRSTTLKHAAAIRNLQEKRRGKQSGSAKSCVVSETDGSMVPVVEIDKQQKDKRKNKKIRYREARVTLARAKGSVTPIYSATFKNIDITGKHMSDCVKRVGVDKHSKIHCVGDGAPWIYEQVEKQFGTQATYLVDFYHVCEYLAAAATTCGKEDPKKWLEAQKALLKVSGVEQVLRNLQPHIEPRNIVDADAPVRTCHRYMSNRKNQLDYKTALSEDLPIGSGEIESAHRHLIQIRLKIPGAWWLEGMAENMLALRTCRANNEWAGYWDKMAE